MSHPDWTRKGCRITFSIHAWLAESRFWRQCAGRLLLAEKARPESSKWCFTRFELGLLPAFPAQVKQLGLP
jgi:hypothetical protein